LAEDATVILEIFEKKTQKTPKSIIDIFRGSQAGFIGRRRGLAPCGSEAREIPFSSTKIYSAE